jgi:hypothetical protein
VYMRLEPTEDVRGAQGRRAVGGELCVVRLAQGASAAEL